MKSFSFAQCLTHTSGKKGSYNWNSDLCDSKVWPLPHCFCLNTEQKHRTLQGAGGLKGLPDMTPNDTLQRAHTPGCGQLPATCSCLPPDFMSHLHCTTSLLQVSVVKPIAITHICPTPPSPPQHFGLQHHQRRLVPQIGVISCLHALSLYLPHRTLYLQYLSHLFRNLLSLKALPGYHLFLILAVLFPPLYHFFYHWISLAFLLDNRLLETPCPISICVPNF